MNVFEVRAEIHRLSHESSVMLSDDPLAEIPPESQQLLDEAFRLGRLLLYGRQFAFAC